MVSIVEQLSQVHNSTAKEALERFCSYLPEKLNLQGICFLITELFGPSLIKLLEKHMNPDVVCHSIHLCEKRDGQPYCHLYPVPEVTFFTQRRITCLLRFVFLSSFIRRKLPYEDMDGDKFSVFPTLRGYHWRGRDCDDQEASGVDPKDGIPYEQKFCTESKGVIILGDSAGAHFHIPPEWLTASQMSVKTFSNLLEVVSDELDWPQFSEVTGFLNSTVGGWTESIYLELLRRNRCNHRDYQNLSKNGAASGNIQDLAESLARSQQFDKPAIVIFAMIGNDVCNGSPDTLEKMTQPEQMHSNVKKTLDYLDNHLPKGSHVILIGLVDGRFLWDNLHKRYHPLGTYNNKNNKHRLFLCFSPQRALQLSSILKEIATSEKYANFDLLYLDYPLKEIVEMWQKFGGEPWQLIEPVDGFHPNQIASALAAKIIWQKLLHDWPHVLQKENPFNKEIGRVFNTQGGH
uniref:Acyloxyacyl hydrolase n=1 Tax=Varanus komodoensis TaxID=61221 RepID=A0A8D2J877_VARKO